MRRFFINKSDVSKPAPVIDGQDAKHIKNVLRLKPGDRIELFDGTGYEYEAKIIGFSSGATEIEIIREYPSQAEPRIFISAAQAFLKDKKMDSLVRQLTELGITGWHPFFAGRSVSKPDPKKLKARRERWKNIAKEALKQCKGGRIPEIGEVLSFKDILNIGKESDLKIVFWEEETLPLETALLPFKRKAEKVFLMLGPEGGFTSEEIAEAKAAGFISASLGPRILKAETASVAACAVIQYVFGDFGSAL